MPPRHLRLPLVLLTLAAFGSGCVGGNLKRNTANDTLFSEDSESASSLANFLFRSSMTPSTTPELWKFCDGVLDRLEVALAKLHPGAHKRYRITVVNSGVVNAASLPNGQIYVTTGLLDVITSEESFASVIGHEIGHAELRHFQEALDRAPLNLLPFTGAFNQNAELEADRYGIELMASAGYRVDKAMQFIEDFQAFERTTKQSAGGFLSTHPSTDSRMSEARQQIAAFAGTHGSNGKSDAPEAGNQLFAAMKKARADRATKYSPRPLAEDEPPRFQSGDKIFDAALEKAARMIRQGHSYDVAEASLKDLVSRADTPEMASALDDWRGRIELSRGFYDKALNTFSQAKKDCPGCFAPVWLSAFAKALAGDRAAAAKEWKDEWASERCRASIPCLEGGLYSVEAAQLSPAELAQAASLLRTKILATSEKQPLGPDEQAALSLAMAYELRSTSKAAAAPVTEPVAPAAFTPSPYYRDTQIEVELERQRVLHPIIEKGLTLGLDLGSSAAGGSLGQLVGTGVQLKLNVGYQYRFLDIGGVVDIQGARSNLGPLDTSPQNYSVMGGGFYATFQINQNRLRPWVGAVVAFDGIYQNYSANPQENAIANGTTAELMGGLLYRLREIRYTNDYYVRLAVGARQSWMGPVEGVLATGLGWEATLGFSARFESLSSSERPLDAAGPTFYSPPSIF